MSYTKTDMLSHKIIEILKEHSDEKHPLTQQQICGYLEEKLGIKPNRKTVAQHLKSIIGDESCNVFIADNDNDDDDKSDKKYITDIYYASDITAEEYEFLADSIIYSPMLPPRNSTDSVVFISDDTSILTVSNSGVVQAVAVSPSSRLNHSRKADYIRHHRKAIGPSGW